RNCLIGINLLLKLRNRRALDKPQCSLLQIIELRPKRLLTDKSNVASHRLTQPTTVGLTPLWRGVSPTGQPALNTATFGVLGFIHS
ncbi:MAG: hypothetical protein AAFP19_16545, partial [Bacteroidota bacterium]